MQMHSCVTREPLVRFLCATHENCLEFRIDFKSPPKNNEFSTAKKFGFFWTYANLCRLDANVADLHIPDAEPSCDQVGQILLHWHHFLKSYAKRPHVYTPPAIVFHI